jgi:hypothetical protein
MTLEITNQVRLQCYPDYWYTVEDIHIDLGVSGCTISYWDFTKEQGEKGVW